jgi:hypothetical protein
MNLVPPSTITRIRASSARAGLSRRQPTGGGVSAVTARS